MTVLHLKMQNLIFAIALVLCSSMKCVASFHASHSHSPLGSFAPAARSRSLSWRTLHNEKDDNDRRSKVILMARGAPRRIPSGRGGGKRRKMGGFADLSQIPFTATNALIAVNVGMFLATMAQPSLRDMLLKSDRAIRYYGQKYRLLSAVFVHGSLYHVGMNCYSLYNIGSYAERIFGTFNFVGAYIGSGLLANIATYTMGSSPVSLGASGCTFGLIGGIAAYLYRNKSVLGKQAEQGLSSIKQTMFINLMYGFAMQGVDNGAHIYGFLGGAFLSFIFGPRLVRFEKNGRRGTGDKPIISTKKLISAAREFAEVVFGDGSGKENKGYGKFYPKQPSFLDEDDEEDLY